MSQDCMLHITKNSSSWTALTTHVQNVKKKKLTEDTLKQGVGCRKITLFRGRFYKLSITGI